MKPKLSAPCLLATLTNTVLFACACCSSAHADEPPQIEYAPVVTTPTITWGNPSVPTLSTPVLAWQNTTVPLQNKPGRTVPPNNSLQSSKTYADIASLLAAPEQKRLQDAQAAVQVSRERLAQAIEKLNNERSLSKSQRVTAQEQIDTLAQQLTQNLSKLKAQQEAHTALQARIKQLQSAGLNLRTSIILPNTPSLTLPQDRNLLYTPADAAALIKRNLLLTPEDSAKVKTIPLHK